MTKIQKAIELITNNPDMSRKQLVSLMMEQLEMTNAGAETYYYNAKKKMAAPTKPAEAAAETESVAAKTDDDWTVAHRAKIDQMIASINPETDIPAFLRKSWNKSDWTTDFNPAR